MLLINTFDVEPWWADLPPCIGVQHWDDMPDRSEVPLHDYLDLCDVAGVKCTFFILGWYARRYPKRVAEIVRRGHEVGCHSLSHEDVATQSTQQFRESTREAKAILEDASGLQVIAYRAPFFSFPRNRYDELLGELSAMGFIIDSSISTAVRLLGGGYEKEEFSKPMNLRAKCGIDLLEVPVPGVTIAGREVPVFGGGYLRLAPRFLLNRIARNQTYQVLYLHPHDFDRDLPRLPGRGVLATLRRRINVGDLRSKVLDLFAASQVRTCGQLLPATR